VAGSSMLQEAQLQAAKALTVISEGRDSERTVDWLLEELFSGVTPLS